MMADWQTPRGPGRRMILNTRSHTLLGTWNVRTMFQTGKPETIAGEMIRYNIQILGLCETRWLNFGEEKIQNIKLIYSGHTQNDASHTYGVGLMMSEQAQKSLISWEPHGPRLLEASFKTSEKDIKLRIIVCYAPTDAAEDEIKDEFYEKLESITRRSNSNKDLLIVLGDLNAKVGSDNTGYERIMGKNGVGDRSDNGERFLQYCQVNNLVIGGTIFPHKTSHKVTWESPGNRVQNQIDHITISRRFRRSLHDVRSKRGADCYSDHHLVIAKIKLKLKKMPSENTYRKKFNVKRLKDANTKETFELEIQNRFAILENEVNVDQDVNMLWNDTKKIYEETCESILGTNRRQEDAWISEHSLQKINERRAAKELLCNDPENPELKNRYKILNKQVKKSVKKDKRDEIESLAKQAEDAAARFDTKEVYNITKKLANKKASSVVHIRDSQGNLITSSDEQQKRWVEHFSQVLNRPRPPETLNINPTPFNLEINTDPPSVSEIKEHVATLKNGKAAGPDNIPPEAIKSTVESSANVLHKILGKIWETNEVPKDWKDGHLTVLPKKGDLTKCDNHRGIMLLSAPGKVLSKILLKRMKDAIDCNLRKNQAGFRSGRSCSDQIVTLRIIIEQCLEMKVPCYLNFIDYQKAFDSIDRTTLWKILAYYGVPEKFIEIIKSLYSEQEVKILFKGKLSEAFKVLTGVRQGCILSPFLFLLAIDYIMRHCSNGNGFSWGDEELDDLDFADDIVLIANTPQQLQNKTDEIQDKSAKIGLFINIQKTKTMSIYSDQNANINVRGEDLEEVNSFTYLGSNMTKQGGTDEDIDDRIRKAAAAYGILSKIWKTSNIGLKTKMQIFNSNVKSVLLYGSESWSLTKKREQKIQVFVNKCLRKILKIYWPQRISNVDLWTRTKQKQINIQIKQRRFKWIGHTLRKQNLEIPKQALDWVLVGTRGRGRPKLTWQRQLVADLINMDKTWDEIKMLAQNRVGWRQFVAGLSPPDG